MRNRRMSLIVWLIAGIIAISAILQMAASIAQAGTQEATLAVIGQVLWALLAIVFAFVYALIVSRQPRNTIGWLLLCPAIALAVPVQSYISSSASSQPTALLLIALWFQEWYWLLLIFPTLFIALLFPTGQLPSKKWRWSVITGLVMVGIFVFFSTFTTQFIVTNSASDVVLSLPNPIGFIPPDAFPLPIWLLSLGFLTVSSVVALIVRYRRAEVTERTQLKWLLYAAITFASIYVVLLLFTTPEASSSNNLDVLIPLALMLIPLAIAVAILRYRLWNIDLIIRRTLVYVPLTAILTGIFAASSSVTQKVLGALTSSHSDASTVLTTLMVAAAFDPVKRWIQRIVDVQFKEVEKPEARWKVYGEQLRLFVQMHDVHATAKRFLEESVMVFETKGGSIFLGEGGEQTRIHIVGEESEAAGITIPLEYSGNQFGTLTLTARRSGRPFDEQDRGLLTENAKYVAAAISLVANKVGQS
jgi:hypothetical protein